MPWEQLVLVKREAMEEARAAAAAPPVACPNDGEPLKAGPSGQLFCPSDGWTPHN